MIGILLASHGTLSVGIENGISCIMGKIENLKTLSLNVSDDINTFGLDMQKAVDDLDDGDGVLILVDLLGGSPCNMAGKMIKSKNIKVVSGLNLPMVFAALEARTLGMNLRDTAIHCITSSQNAIKDLEDVINFKSEQNQKRR